MPIPTDHISPHSLSLFIFGNMSGSHGIYELHAPHVADELGNPTEGGSVAMCQICGDKIGLEENGRDMFVACHECGFPICRPCYDYERSEGHHNCPQCHTHYKPLKCGAKIERDDEENAADDSASQFHLRNNSSNQTLDPHHLEQNSNRPQIHVQEDDVPSVAASVAGKDLEGEKESEEWKERMKKWKTRQERRGLITKASDGGQEDEDDDFL